MLSLKASFLMLVVLMFAGPNLISCGEGHQSDRPKTEEEQSNAQTVSQVKEEPTLDQIVDYQRKIKTRLEKLDKGIEQLKVKTQKLDREMNFETKKAIEELDWKKEYAHTKLDELQAANEAAWYDIKSEMDSTIKDLEKSYQKALSELNGNKAAVPEQISLPTAGVESE